ncbi:MAG: hypothetical protein HYS98_06215 [Deltaproteobacteria bacterium]|nr:hypothetical protein [Deltaproteobacteria bacterium]
MTYRKSLFALITLFLLFFFTPIIIYSFSSKYFGMEPPFKIYTHELSYLISLQFFQAFVFFITFWFIARLKKEKAFAISIFTSILLFFLAEFSPKMIHAFSFHYMSSIYLKVSLLAGLITYTIGGLILGKVFQHKKEGIYL